MAFFMKLSLFCKYQFERQNIYFKQSNVKNSKKNPTSFCATHLQMLTNHTNRSFFFLSFFLVFTLFLVLQAIGRNNFFFFYKSSRRPVFSLRPFLSRDSLFTLSPDCINNLVLTNYLLIPRIWYHLLYDWQISF